MSDPSAGVNVCLISQDGRSLLHRVPPVNDPQEAASSMEDICSVGGRALCVLMFLYRVRGVAFVCLCGCVWVWMSVRVRHTQKKTTG